MVKNSKIYRKYIDVQRKFKFLTRGLVRGNIQGGLDGKHGKFPKKV